MEKIIIQKRHLAILLNKDMKDEFVTGLISILNGKEAQTSDRFMKKVFFDLVHGHMPKGIPGIPKFDQTGMKKSELDRYNKLQAGKVPSAGLDHSHADLKFKPITSLEKGYLNKLYKDCLGRIQDKTHTPKYRRFIIYLAEVMEHCADSGEVL